MQEPYNIFSLFWECLKELLNVLIRRLQTIWELVLIIWLEDKKQMERMEEWSASSLKEKRLLILIAN